MRRFLALLLLLGAVGVGMLVWAIAAWNARGPETPNGQLHTVILIPPHMRVHDIAGKLDDAGIITSAPLFEFNLRARQLSAGLKAGEYAIPAHTTMAGVAAILASGKSIEHKLTAAEGLTSAMIAKLVADEPALSGAVGPAPREGVLLPETYLFTRGTPRADLLARMKKAQDKFLAARWASRAADLPFDTMDQAVTLASIVEKESALPDERRHIAAVFINRLRAGMRLQSDPTIIYGLTKGYPLGRGIRQSEIEDATPYNTYAISGLPPGPICNPGKDSLAAVLDPLQSKDLYFVANGKGGHVFAATIAEHARNVVAWRAVEKRKDQAPPLAGSRP